MHANQLLNNHLMIACQGVHKKRMTVLMTVVNALMTGKKLSVTGLGRAISNDTKTKHYIKRVDRLVGSMAVNHDRQVINQTRYSKTYRYEKYVVDLTIGLACCLAYWAYCRIKKLAAKLSSECREN